MLNGTEYFYSSVHFTRVSRTLIWHDAKYFAFEFKAKLEVKFRPCNTLYMDFQELWYGFSENQYRNFHVNYININSLTYI